MAEIRVERKSVAPWWMWAVLALFVLAIVWGYLAMRGHNTTADSAAVTAESERARSVDGVNDLLVIVTAPERRAFLGRNVQLTHVTVLDVVGDKTFWIGPSNEQRLFVVLNEVPGSSRPGVEGRYNINPGQVLNLTGTIQELPDAATARAQWGEAGATAAREEQVYLFAQKAEIIQEH